MRKLTFFIILVISVIFPGVSRAQEEDLSLQAVWVQGKVTAYHDQTDSTTPLRKKQVVDDGDWVTTGPKSRVVLRMKDRTYLLVAPNTRISISRLNWGERGPNCQMKLTQGRILFQFDQTPNSPFDVTAGNVLFAAHGTLFEVSLKKDVARVISFEGSVVATSHGKAQIAKTLQSLKYEKGYFRSKNYHLKNEEQGHLQEWQDLLASFESKTGPEKP